MTSAKPNGLSLLLLWINRIYKMIYTDMKCDIIRWDPYLCPCKALGNEISIIRYIMVVKDGLSKNKNRKRQLCRNLCRTQYKRHMRTLSHAITMSPPGERWKFSYGQLSTHVLTIEGRKSRYELNFQPYATFKYTHI